MMLLGRRVLAGKKEYKQKHDETEAPSTQCLLTEPSMIPIPIGQVCECGLGVCVRVYSALFFGTQSI